MGAELGKLPRVESIPPMRSWTGWTEKQIRAKVERLIAHNGLALAARLCGVSTATLIKFRKSRDVSLGTLVKIAESMP